MGKTLKIAGALLLICALSFAAATAFFIAASDDVEVLPKTLYGDPTAAEGLKVDFRVQHHGTLHWDIHCNPVTGESDTDFIFDRDDPFFEHWEYTPSGVQMYAVMDYRSHRFYWNMDDLQATPKDSGLFKLGEYLKSLPLLENEQDGSATLDLSQEETFHTIDLSDFFEYYPFEGEVDLWDAGHIPSWDVCSIYRAENYDSSKMLSQLFQNHFKIPVPDNATILVNIFEYRDGQRDFHFGGFPEDTAFFYPENYGFTVGNSCYFVFSETMGNDVSQIPGGWGIYRLDYTLMEKEQDIETAQLSTVYSLNPDTYVQDMVLSADGKRILLTNVRDGCTYLTVIDLATMKQLQEIELYSGAEQPYIHVDIHDDFVLTQCTEQLCVYQLLPDGTYELRIDVDLSATGYPSDLDRHNDHVSFDGQRLAVAQVLFREIPGNGPVYGSETAGFTLQIYDSTGLLYYGEYGTTLETANWDSIRYGQHIYPNYNAPFYLMWE